MERSVFLAGAAAFCGCPSTIVPPAGDGRAKIVAVCFDRRVYKWGDLARVAVVTSTETSLVEMRVVSYGRALTRRRPGLFEGVYRMPFLPPLLDRLHVELPFRFIARADTGPAAELQQIVRLD